MLEARLVGMNERNEPTSRDGMAEVELVMVPDPPITPYGAVPITRLGITSGIVVIVLGS